MFDGRSEGVKKGVLQRRRWVGGLGGGRIGGWMWMGG